MIAEKAKFNEGPSIEYSFNKRGLGLSGIFLIIIIIIIIRVIFIQGNLVNTMSIVINKGPV